MGDWKSCDKPDCINCINLKYLQDPSTTVCVTCSHMNGLGYPDHWESCITEEKNG